MKVLVLLLWIIQNSVLLSSSTLPDTIKIVGMFEDQDSGAEMAFRETIEEINVGKDILPRSVNLQASIVHVIHHDIFGASMKVCEIIEGGVAAIFGPASAISSRHIQSMCNSLSIPYIQTHWESSERKDRYTIQLFPHSEALGGAYVDIIKYWQWTKFTVLYDDNEGMIRLQEVWKLSNDSKIQMTVRKLDTFDDKWVNMFKTMKAQQEHRIIIDCHVNKIHRLLLMDLELVDLKWYSRGGANITSFRVIDPSNPKVQVASDDWMKAEIVYKRKSPLQCKESIPTDVALIYDAVYLTAIALRDLSEDRTIVTDKKITCLKPKTWADGQRFLNYMEFVKFDGLTGKVTIINGQRKDFQLDIIELTEDGLRKIGSWDPKQKINITKTVSERKKEIKSNLKKRALKVVTKLDKPYVMLRDVKKPGDPSYEGFAIDLLDELSRRLNFTYDIYDVDGYGRCTTWDNGSVTCDFMLQELRDKKADLAVAGLTITHDRERYVDFTKPFLNLGITILYKKPVPEPPGLFSFLNPLSIDVWIYLLGTFLCVSFMLFVIARLTPYEWKNPHPGDSETDVVENQFSIRNSLWCFIGALMQQGSEIAPQAISTRLLSCCWWFFTLIIISSYTANLAAFLTVERMISPIESAEDLAKRSDISYGTQKEGSSTYDFFKTSKFQTYKTLWNVMSNKNDVFVDNNDMGTAKVENEEYAFFTESTYVEYITAFNCDLMQVNGLLDSKGYGIALQTGSPYRDLLSSEILDMAEKQIIAKYKERWWKEKTNGTVCDAKKKKGNTALTMKNVGGVFVVVAGGAIGGFIVAICEFVYKSWQNAKEDKQTLWSEMSEELRFAVPCCRTSQQEPNRDKKLEVIHNDMIYKRPKIPNNNDGTIEEY